MLSEPQHWVECSRREKVARDNRSEEGDNADDTDDEGASGSGLNP